MTKYKFTEEDSALLGELGVEVEAKKAVEHTSREERIIAGFEEIKHFYEKSGRLPSISEGADVFEKIYAVRLDRIKSLDECRTLLADIDEYDLLGSADIISSITPDSMTDDELLDELGVDMEGASSITKLKYVKPRVEINSAEEVATRTRCPDFDKFKPLFIKAKQDMKSDVRDVVKFKNDASVAKGDFFILAGQVTYVAEKSVEFTNKYGRKDSELRVIYDNGTQTEGMLMRSLQRALNKDTNARRIGSSEKTSLFSDNFEKDDSKSGSIYVLRSLSENPFVAEHRDIVHKIGVTSGDVKKRVTNAKIDPTFLMADVEIVATYKLANINQIKLEALIHRFFAEARLDIDITDRFGKLVTAREWFLAPLFIIDQMIEKLKEGSLSEYYYNKETATIKKFKT